MLSYLETKQLFEEDVITRTGTLLCFGKGQSSASACSLRWVREGERSQCNQSFTVSSRGIEPFSRLGFALLFFLFKLSDSVRETTEKLEDRFKTLFGAGVLAFLGNA